MTGRRWYSAGCSGRAESVRLHGQPREKGRRYVNRSGGSEVSAIHYPQWPNLIKETVRSGKSEWASLDGYNVPRFLGKSVSLSGILPTYKNKTEEENILDRCGSLLNRIQKLHGDEHKQCCHNDAVLISTRSLEKESNLLKCEWWGCKQTSKTFNIALEKSVLG